MSESEKAATCGTCRYWQLHPPELQFKQGVLIGNCRRYPPTSDYENQFPTTHGTSWCGEHVTK